MRDLISRGEVQPDEMTLFFGRGAFPQGLNPLGYRREALSLYRYLRDRDGVGGSGDEARGV